METAARINRLFMGHSSLSQLVVLQTKHGRFYNQLAQIVIEGTHRKHFLREIGDKLVILAEQSHALRRMDALEEVSQILVSLPLPKRYQAIGWYYQALCIQRFGQGDNEKAACLLEQLSENAPLQYRLRAMASLGANRFNIADYKSSLMFYQEAGRLALQSGFYDPYTTVTAQRMVSVINSLDGNHSDAVTMLENLFPLAHSMRAVYPHVYYDYLNSFAVELGEVGRLEEAQNVSRITLASSYADAYPEWRDTYEEIAMKRRSTSRPTVAIRQKIFADDNLVHFSAPQRGEGHQTTKSSPARRPAQVFNLGEWKKRLKKEPADTLHDNFTEDEIRRMSREEKLCAIARLIYADDAQEKMLDKFLEIAHQLRSTRTDMS